MDSYIRRYLIIKKRMKIKAKFKGQDSLGYEKGKNYHLLFYTTGNGLGQISRIIIKDLAHSADNCEYESLKGFLNNWQVL